ncbi:MAG: DUF6600 domain-containing protein [Chthoniobacteraceae bacterium]
MTTRNLLSGILLAVAAASPFGADAGTLFYVPVPATGSDAQAGIESAKVYTSAIDAGNTSATGRTVNGVGFAALTGSGNTSTANGVTLSVATGVLTNGGGQTDSIQADGALAGVLSGMTFNDGADDDSEQYVVLEPSSLTAGKTYDLRVFVCNSSGQNRQVNLSFAGDGQPAVSTGFFNEDDATTSPGGFTEPNQVYYINYRFTWDGVNTPGFTATQRFGSMPFSLYALTNQEVGDANARPVGAVVAEQPERIAAGPTTRRTPTNFVNYDEDIGIASEVFYESDSLRRHGRWVNVGRYGRCWQPTGIGPDWQPYTRGRWVHSQYDGWAWDSDEDFGWATYHYGRWFREQDSGWYWVPGRVWAPSWVSWRYGRSHVGWAPLPPVAIAIAGFGISSWADHRWGIGPQAYNFVNVRDFGAPSLAGVLLPRQQNVVIMTTTNNITNIVNNQGGIYSGGPNFQTVNNAIGRSGGRPIDSVRIDRRADTKPLTPDGKHSQLKEGVLAVTAPNVTRSKKSAPVPAVAATIATPKIDKGWSGLPDTKQASTLQTKIANEIPGEKAKRTAAVLPGTLPTKPGGVRSKNADLPKPGRPVQSADTTRKKPGQPVKPTDITGTKSDQPVTPPEITRTKPGQPFKQTDATRTKPGKTVQRATEVIESPKQPAKQLKDGVTAATSRSKRPPQTVQPAPVRATPIPAQEPVRQKKRAPQPAPQVQAPAQPQESGRSKKRAPQVAQPIAAPARQAPAPAPAQKFTPPAKGKQRPVPPSVAPVNPGLPPSPLAPPQKGKKKDDDSRPDKKR